MLLLRHAHSVCIEDRYRLDPVDDHSRMIPDAPAGYVCIRANELSAEPPPLARPVSPGMDHAVIEAMRLKTELARTVIDKFPLMMESAATLLRAADGAGMGVREPRGLPEHSEAEEEEDEDNELDEVDEVEAEVPLSA